MLIVPESRTKFGLFVLLTAAVAALLAGPSAAWAGHVYTTLLPPGWSEAIPSDISEGGAVVGHGLDPADPTGPGKGFLYKEGVYADVRPAGWTVGYALGINDDGLVVGHGWDGAGERGFLYDHAAGTYTSFMPAGWLHAYAFDVNNDGLVAGWGNDGTDEKSFVYDSTTGSYVEIPPQSGVSQPRGVMISEAGVLLGYDGGGPGWFTYAAGTFTHIPPPPGWSYAAPNDVNAAGVIVGQGRLAGSSMGFIYENGAYTTIMPAGWNHASAGGINDDGVIVGDGLDANNGSVTFLYAGETYTWVPLPPGWIWAYAYRLTSDRQFIGYGEETPGTLLGCLATHVPEAEDPLDYFDSAVSAGTLSGTGPTATSADGKLQALRSMLETAEALIEDGYYSEACDQLEAALRKTDGSPVPPDFVTGVASVELAAQIEALMSALGCT